MINNVGLERKIVTFIEKSTMTQKRRWKKNLYENVDYEDNYTDKSFLEELRKNVNVTEITFLQAVLGAGLVAQALCTVIIFSLIFVYLYNGWVEAETFFVQSSLITAVAYLSYCIIFRNGNQYRVMIQDLRMVLIFVIFGYVLSPVLKTLTDTISTDTIYAMSTFMMMVHLIFFDYGVPAAIVSSSLSLNAAIFASICLASRLSSPFHAFVLLTNAVECFALFPILLAESRGSILVLITMVSLSTCALWTVSFTMMILFISVTLFITLLCPLWFLSWQRYKENIYGPWDEAIVHDIQM